MTKTFKFQSLALVASMGLCAALTSGCNPEEPAKTTTPPPAVTAPKPAPTSKPADVKTPPAATTPAPEKTK